MMRSRGGGGGLWPIAAVVCALSLPGGPARGQGSLWTSQHAGAESYVVFDPLFMQRDNALHAQPLVIDGNTQQTVIASGDLQFPVAPGLRLLVGQHGPDRLGWEIGYVGVFGMFADALATAADTLEIAPPLSSEVFSLRGASTARVTYGSALNMAEANFMLTERSHSRTRPSAYSLEGYPCTATLDWLTGFRWAGLQENAAIDLASSAPGIASGYAVRSSSNLVGWQLGLRGRADWRAVAVEGWGKAALAGSFLSQSQDPIVDALTGDEYRSGRGARTAGAAGVFDLGGAVVFPFGEKWGLRLGATMLCLAGVALAPDQFDFSNDLLAGTTVDGGQTLWLGGASLGLEGRW